MELDFTLTQYLLIGILGIVAGIINMMAGGGSNLILPVLMMFGIPADIANGTNRVGVLLQSVSGLQGFYKAGKLPTADLPAIMLPTLIGGIIGALAASFAPVSILKPMLLLTMLGVAALVAFRPDLLVHAPDVRPVRVADRPQSRWALAAVGIYGGFVQAAAGFVLLPVLAGMLCYDLVRANALKVCCTLGFTLVALAIFISRGQVMWDIGLVLAICSALGARIGVKTAIKLQPDTLRKILFAMTLIAVVLALLK
ncbi:sulfite exporter TauE/SafE family protein [Neisseria animalis]|uniref:Probable membrane transporter protein n=1 Tax=Neisseria animalis TaxID=492 RepID=A0A5P3MPX6_NEIAN|nr:sulfite exporter TauE/SafE family protein [Neisseria animalis]QEY23613.1 sulfite exporter TauE/SafE family protein [Neisseria animalis]ROW32758.1 sulfite exporter TauE/SafE family protein [Neisseria animalis]VEE09337.1 Sulfite exporter TauE/SafE [Neisseria animalis]